MTLRGIITTWTALSLAAGFAGCSNQDPNAPVDRPAGGSAAAEVQPEQTFRDYRLIETDAGVRKYVLDSDRMEKFPNRSELHLVRVKMDFFRDGAYFSTLVSDSGRANPESKDVFVWGHVVLTTTDGRRLVTEELRYERATGLIHNDVFNTFDRGEDIVTGIGLEATPDLEYIVIQRQVEATVGDETAQEAE